MFQQIQTLLRQKLRIRATYPFWAKSIKLYAVIGIESVYSSTLKEPMVVLIVANLLGIFARTAAVLLIQNFLTIGRQRTGDFPGSDEIQRKRYDKFSRDLTFRLSTVFGARCLIKDPEDLVIIVLEL